MARGVTSRCGRYARVQTGTSHATAPTSLRLLYGFLCTHVTNTWVHIALYTVPTRVRFKSCTVMHVSYISCSYYIRTSTHTLSSVFYHNRTLNLQVIHIKYIWMCRGVFRGDFMGVRTLPIGRIF
jgi:hypothetical protein